MSDITDNFLPDLMSEHGLVLKRDSEHGVFTNALHLVTHHSPTGFEFGYGGSGPADLALNVVEMILYSLKYTGSRMACYQGECFTLSWLLHQEFKRRFIATVPREGGCVSYDQMLAWIKIRIPSQPDLEG